MKADRESYYRDVAKRMAASARLYGADAVVHVEAQQDIHFWESMLVRYRPGKYMFIPATPNERGNYTSGCTQCLKYRKYLSRRFFICIDSDLRRLSGESLRADRGILQTFTYSWENHCCFAPALNRRYRQLTGKRDFDFETFLTEYSRIIYGAMLVMLANEIHGTESFGKDDFRRCITQTYRAGDELDNGRQMLERIRQNLSHNRQSGDMPQGTTFAHTAAQMAGYGLTRDNAYLYARGHCVYNMVLSLGKKLCEDTGVIFERDILLAPAAFGEYDEINSIADAISQLDTLNEYYQ